MSQPNNFRRCHATLDQDSSLIAIVEMKRSSWLVAGIVPGISRHHCSMVLIPSLEEEDAKRSNRERESLVGERTRIVNRMKSLLARLGIRDFKPTLRKAPEHLATLRAAEGMRLPPNTLALRRDKARLRFVMDQITEIEQARLDRIARGPEEGMHAMVRVLAGVKGIGVETADMLVHEIFSRPPRDRRAVARYAGLTGSRDESGGRRREKGLVSQWFRFRAENARGTRKTMIVALARNLLIALWRLTRTGELPEGVVSASLGMSTNVLHRTQKRTRPAIAA